jgi:hypothetical protein
MFILHILANKAVLKSRDSRASHMVFQSFKWHLNKLKLELWFIRQNQPHKYMRSLLFIVLAAAADDLYDCEEQIKLQKNGSLLKPQEKCLEQFCDFVVDTNDSSGLNGIKPAVLDTIFRDIFRDMLSLDYCECKGYSHDQELRRFWPNRK